MADGTKYTSFPVLRDPQGQEMGWFTDPVTKIDYQMSLNRISIFVGAQNVTDLTATNQILATISGGLLVTNDVTKPVPITATTPIPVSGTVNVGNQAPYPTTMTVTGNVGLTGNTAVTLAASALPLPTVGPAAKAAWDKLMFFGSSVPVALTNTPTAIAALVNPANSGKNLYLRGLSVAAGVGVAYSRHRIAGVPAGGAAATIFNAGGGAAGVGKILTSPTGLTPTDANREYYGTNDSLAFDGTYVLPPGTTLLIVAATTVSLLGQLLGGAGNAALGASYWEGPVT